MECRECAAEIAVGAKFCEQCGAPAPRQCPACGAAAEVWSKSCAKCGTDLDGIGVGVQSAPVTDRNSLGRPMPGGGAHAGGQAELRQTTILVCDLVDSTALTHTLDPEDNAKVVRGFLERSSALVSDRHRGHIVRYTGDGLLACFGYPQAQEDDTERAVRAGLDLVAMVQSLRPVPGVSLQVRVGIATGMVVAGDLIGDGRSREAALAGPTPTVAAQLQAAATPGTVVISPTTRKLVGNLFDCVDLGPLQFESAVEPVRAWRVVGEHPMESRFEALHPAGSLTPLVGREHEMRRLLDRWRVAKGGTGQIVLLRGEPGIGKSRLARALLETVKQEPCTVLRYYCAPRFQHTALHPILGQIERDAGFARDDSPEVKLEKLEALFAHGTPREQLPGSMPYVAALLSIPTEHKYPPVQESPELQKQRVFAALKAQPAALAAQQPVLMIAEDLHWADATTLELIGQFIEDVERLGVLFVMTARPEHVPSWAGRPHTQVLDLARLPRLSAASVVSYLTGGKPLPTSVLEQILERSDGVPLFIEELTKSVLESGVVAERADHFTLSAASPARAVPSTLQDSLMARLDRLSTVKDVAQIGAAIGREFSHELLAALLPISPPELEAVLTRLKDADLVQMRGTPPKAMYIFKHALIHDAAYASMLRSRRSKLHARIAEVLEAQAPGVSGREPEVLAHHWTAAGMPIKAIPYWQQAGMYASSRAAHVEAIHHFLAALDLLPHLSEESTRRQFELSLRVQLGLSLSASRGYAAPEVEAAYQRARTLCHELGETAELYPVIRGLCTFYIVRAELHTAKELAEQCVRLGKQTQDAAYLIEGYTALGYILYYMGQLADGCELLAEAVRVYRGNAGETLTYPSAQDPAVACLCLLSHAYWLRGEGAAATRCQRELLEHVERLGRPFDRAYALCFVAMLENLRRNPAAAARLAGQAIQVSQTHGFGIWLCAGTMHLAIAKAALGEAEEAAAMLSAALTAWQGGGAELSVPYFLLGLALCHRAAGNLDAALTAIDDALAGSARHGERYLDAELHRVRGELLLQQGNQPQDAEADLRAAARIAAEQGGLLLELRAAASLYKAHPGRPTERVPLHGIIAALKSRGVEGADVSEAEALAAEGQM